MIFLIRARRRRRIRVLRVIMILRQIRQGARFRYVSHAVAFNSFYDQIGRFIHTCVLRHYLTRSALVAPHNSPWKFLLVNGDARSFVNAVALTKVCTSYLFVSTFSRCFRNYSKK